MRIFRRRGVDDMAEMKASELSTLEDWNELIEEGEKVLLAHREQLGAKEYERRRSGLFLAWTMVGEDLDKNCHRAADLIEHTLRSLPT